MRTRISVPRCRSRRYIDHYQLLYYIYKTFMILCKYIQGAQCVVMTDGDPMAVDLAGINKDQNLNLPNMHVVNPMKLLW